MVGARCTCPRRYDLRCSLRQGMKVRLTYSALRVSSICFSRRRFRLLDLNSLPEVIIGDLPAGKFAKDVSNATYSARRHL